MLLTVASVQAQTETSISVDVAPSYDAGSDAYVGVTLDADIDAIATLTVTGGANYNETFKVALVGGYGSSSGLFTVPNLPVGTYSMTASFAGNDQYAASTSEVQTVEVSKVTTALALSLRDETIYVGDFTAFNVELQDLDDHNIISTNGVVTVRLTEKETFNETTDKVYTVGLVNGKACQTSKIFEEDGNRSPKDEHYTICDLPAGTYKLKAFYAGNGVYSGCESDVVTLTVNKIATTLNVTDITDITTGQDAVITVTATPTDENLAAVNTVATVTVGDTDYDIAIVNGTGTCYVPNLTADTYDVTASIGDDKYADTNSGAAKKLTVTGTNLIKESNAVATVTVTPAINTIAQVTMGNATYYVPVVNGEGTLTLPQQVAGTYTVSAALSEDGKYLASTSDETQLVAVTGVTFPFATGQTWATWCDDYAWKKPADVTAYTISAISGNTVTISEVEGDNIPSHTPLLLKKTGDAVTPTAVKAATGTDALVSTAATGATFYGNASDTQITDGYNYAYGNSYGLYNGEFVLIDTYSGIPANRCLLTLGSNTGAPVLNISEEATSLSSIDNGQLIIDNSWFTLDGRKLDGMPTKKGIYINGGRKVVVK